VWPEVWPKEYYPSEALTAEYNEKSKIIERIRKTNKEALNYWNNLFAECEKAVKKSHTAHGGHEEESNHGH
jgi:hypothetical protein